jgi:hypothetical protein
VETLSPVVTSVHGDIPVAWVQVVSFETALFMWSSVGIVNVIISLLVPLAYAANVGP